MAQSCRLTSWVGTRRRHHRHCVLCKDTETEIVRLSLGYTRPLLGSVPYDCGGKWGNVTPLGFCYLHFKCQSDALSFSLFANWQWNCRIYDSCFRFFSKKLNVPINLWRISKMSELIPLPPSDPVPRNVSVCIIEWKLILLRSLLQELDILSLTDENGKITERNKRTIDILRQLFPTLTQVRDNRSQSLSPWSSPNIPI